MRGLGIEIEAFKKDKKVCQKLHDMLSNKIHELSGIDEYIKDNNLR